MFSSQRKDLEKIFANSNIRQKRLLSRMYKEFLKLKSKKKNQLIRKWAKNMKRYFTEEDIQMANKDTKRC